MNHNVDNGTCGDVNPWFTTIEDSSGNVITDVTQLNDDLDNLTDSTRPTQTITVETYTAIQTQIDQTDLLFDLRVKLRARCADLVGGVDAERFSLIINDVDHFIGEDGNSVGSNEITGDQVGLRPLSNPDTTFDQRDSGIFLPGDEVTLDGGGSYDVDGTIVSYLWEHVSGPENIIINDPSVEEIRFTTLVEGVYVFSLTVTDDLGATGTVSVTITIDAPDSFSIDQDIGDPDTADHYFAVELNPYSSQTIGIYLPDSSNCYTPGRCSPSLGQYCDTTADCLYGTCVPVVP